MSLRRSVVSLAVLPLAGGLACLCPPSHAATPEAPSAGVHQCCPVEASGAGPHNDTEHSPRPLPCDLSCPAGVKPNDPLLPPAGAGAGTWPYPDEPASRLPPLALRVGEAPAPDGRAIIPPAVRLLAAGLPRAPPDA